MPKLNRAAFSREDVEDAKRGHPDVDLRAFAAERGLEFLDRATPAGFRAVVPCDEERQWNVMRGVLPGDEYGVMAHEGLGMRWTNGGADWGGTYHGYDVRLEGVGLRGLLPFSGKTNEAVVRIPCTVAGARVPFTVGVQPYLRIDTRRSAPPYVSTNRVDLGGSAWSLFADPKTSPGFVGELVDEQVAELLRAHSADGLFQAVVEWGTLLVRRNGYLQSPAELEELGDATSLLARRLREVCLPLCEPLPFDAELRPPLSDTSRDLPPGFYPNETWRAWARDAAATYALTLEDPTTYHRAFPTAPIPGMAHVVMRGELPGAGRGRLLVLRDGQSAKRAAVLVAAPAGAEPTPPGGVKFDAGTKPVRVEVADGLLAAWSLGSYWGNAMVGDVDAFLADAGAAVAQLNA